MYCSTGISALFVYKWLLKSSLAQCFSCCRAGVKGDWYSYKNHTLTRHKRDQVSTECLFYRKGYSAYSLGSLQPPYLAIWFHQSSQGCICHKWVPNLGQYPQVKLGIVQQLDVRLEQFTFFPSQVKLISTRSRRDVANYSAQYIKYVVSYIT